MSNDDSTPTPGEIDGLVDEVLRLDGEATPGPWDKRWNLWSGEGVTVYAENDRTGDGPIIYGSGMDAQANCELTAEYRTAAPALARALQAERAEVQRLRESTIPLDCGKAQGRCSVCHECAARLFREAQEHREELAAEVQHLRSVLDAAPHGSLTDGERAEVERVRGLLPQGCRLSTRTTRALLTIIDRLTASRGVDPLSPVGSGAGKGGTP